MSSPLAPALIRLTRNDETFKNGEVVKVVSLEGVHADLDAPDKASISHHRVNLNSSKHLDHAYTLTVHAAQGASKQRAIFAISLPEAGKGRIEAMTGQLVKVLGDRSYLLA